MKKNILFLTLLLSVTSLLSQAPEGYYSQAEGKSRNDLKLALWGIIKKHTQLSYSDVWKAYKTTDTDEEGYIIDMYNNCHFIYEVDQHRGGSSGNASNQCLVYNREHSMPKSWFHDGYPMYTDLHHLYPVSGYINTKRYNYPYAEVDNPEFTSTAGSKLGPSSTGDFKGKAFEPLDEYKGDLARTYFYMAACYHDKILKWESEMFSRDNLTDFSPWALEMLLRWHEEDPVSEKETKRNDEVFKIQKNRNPFIDYPELVDKIWGDDWTPFGDEPDDPTLNETNFPTSCKITVQGHFIHVQNENGPFDSIRIYNSQGQLMVGSQVRQQEFGYTVRQAGIYIIQLSFKGRTFSKKIVVR